jgi:DNA helicase-2/ATP-dependent DNA helicase PcrA
LDWEGKDSGGERSLFFVGDIDQSIYGWRGAEPDLILGLPNSHNAKVLKLEDNYRSIEPILQLANHLIKKNENRIDKILIASRTKEVPVSFEKPINFQWSGGEGDEAIWVAEKIKENLAHGYSPSDILILFRTNSQSRSFEAVLSGESLPYKLVNAFKFYDRKEVRDILGYLIFANNPKQDTILKRIINTPRRGIGGMTMNAIEELAQSRKSSMWEVLTNSCSDLNCGAAAKAGIRNFVLIVQSIAQLKLSDTLIQDVIDISGYSKYLESLTQDEMIERSSNLKELQSAIDIHLRSKEPKTISDFLQAIAFNEKTDITDSIKLMTCHSAKGLEFPIVFVTGLEEGTFPSRRSETSLEIEEERRLMYVAITRAQDKLYLSGSSFRYNNHCSPSRFLLEMKE